MEQVVRLADCKPWIVTDYLDSPEMIAAYLEAHVEDAETDPANAVAILSNAMRDCAQALRNLAAPAAT